MGHDRRLGLSTQDLFAFSTIARLLRWGPVPAEEAEKSAAHGILGVIKSAGYDGPSNVKHNLERVTLSGV